MKKKKQITKSIYPLCNKLGLTIISNPVEYIDRFQLRDILNKNNIADMFSEYFGIQTAYVKGPYAWDVEAVLTRIYKNKLIGSQLNWD